ncbi:MAG TPA: helix-turn-helix transcriptional regulator [Methanocellales archaeon]|nr:helix-turn-helix transcriptional regulator [Methanocellales archaeon]
MKRYRLIAKREKRGLTLLQLANEFGISKAKASHIETGRHWPSGKVNIRLELFIRYPSMRTVS